MFRTRTFRTTAALVTVTLASAAASAQNLPVLLEIDPSDPSAVTITSTGAASVINDSSATNNSGVSLLGVFSADFPITNFGGVILDSTLVVAGQVNGLDYTNNNTGSLTPLDLNIFYDFIGDDTIFFNTVDPAFTGLATGDFSGSSWAAPGTTGDIIVGNTSGGSGAVLGAWRIVPAPGALALLPMAGLAGMRRRR